ncbi:efflux RND transporter periplasmic adaptor subunit [Paenibacillus sp. 23TSA30-6]|uniref:efflux RND transporter periplasmic adaptor subunit n=1 Tax=Paenibacillus sp. 23TSA30-6 TaxID=2546104 RepID=UPI001787E609|nr:efflux RND transporter periplasmic adaptor subunit [Paenibacillus sp. 23TSA30-6]MBE0337509.1 efflux RND transporter periplasmic adaptor subunit [Paenibacillus sp. 23TSA30-6]
MNKQRTIIILTLSLSIAIAGCSAGKEDAALSSAAQPVAVRTAIVKSSPLHTAYNLSGTLQAYEENTLAFQNGGTVASASLSVGTAVQKGAVIARLDDADYKLQVEQAAASIQEAQAGIDNAQANLQAAASAIQSADAGIAGAGANVSKVNKGARAQEKQQAQATVDKAQSAYTKAKTDSERTQKLFEAGAATASDNESARLNATAALKDLEQAKDSLSLLLEGATTEDHQSAQASFQDALAGRSKAIAASEQAAASKKQASANYEKALVAKSQAELALSRTRLISPVNGVILDKIVNTGDLVSSGQAVYRIGSIDRLKVLLPVPDSEIRDWKKGQQVSVMLYEETRQGTVSNVYPSTSTNTGRVNVEIVISNPQRNWLPGQVIKAAHQVTDKNGILIPAEAVINTGSKPFIFKDVQGKAVKTPVELGNQVVENQLQIVSGLREGERIVIKGAETLFDGNAIQSEEGGRP